MFWFQVLFFYQGGSFDVTLLLEKVTKNHESEICMKYENSEFVTARNQNIWASPFGAGYPLLIICATNQSYFVCYGS